MIVADRPFDKAQDRLKGRKTLQVSNFLDEFEKDDIKKEVDIVHLFKHFGITLTKKGKSFIGLCPWHEDKNPSLSVDRAKGLYNCFGCGESGDIFTLTEKMKGLNFRDSLTYLKDFTGRNSLPNKDTKPLKLTAFRPQDKQDNGIKTQNKDTGKGEIKGRDEELNSSLNLSVIAEYYHKKLFDNPKALEYLRKRGFENPQLLSRFKIGFADGSLLDKISEAQKKELLEQGIITEKAPSTSLRTSREHFESYITFPIFDDIGKVVGMYGRSINQKADMKHLYLKGKHRSVFNRKASRVYDELILTESIIDALSLIELGFKNTQSIYGINGFTEEHLSILKDDRVKRIILAFDSDDAGKDAGERLKEKLIPEGFAVKVIFPPFDSAQGEPHDSAQGEPHDFAQGEPHDFAQGEPGVIDKKIPERSRGKDWNDYLVQSGEPGVVKELINKAEIFKPKAEKDFKAEKNHLGYIFTTDDLTYRVTGVKEMFINNLRVNIRAGFKGTEERYYDNLDLYSARSRNTYSQNLSREFNIEQKRIEKDLIRILEYLEGERDRKLLLGKDFSEKREMTDAEKELGMEFLKNSNMYNEIISDMTRLGFVGEDSNKLLVWLAGISRLLPKPLSVFIQSPPSTGKSYLLETLLKLLPEESAEWITSVSDQSFNYMEEEDFVDKVFMLGEALHNETVEGYIRQMQSENKIARKVTVKDPKSGIMKTITVKHEVRLVFMMTSTAMKVNNENLSRCLVFTVDNSREQTERVLAIQLYKSSYEGHLEERHVIPEIIKKHRSAQRLLKKIPVFNPFEKIRFPSNRALMRRGQAQFLGLIASSCVARQMQKEPIKKENHFTGETEYIYECDYVDYETARRLFIECRLIRTDEDLSESVIGLYESIRDMARKKAKKEVLLPVEVTFIQSEIREITHLSNETVKKYMRILLEYEYLVLVGGRRHGTRFSYRLREDVPIEQIDIASIIPTVEEIKLMMLAESEAEPEEDKKMNLS